MQLDTPRDRAGTFEPKIVRKRQRRFEGFDEKILALYSRGLSTRDIEAHLQEIYGVKVGRDLISKVTDAVMDDARAWQIRPLEDVYPVVFLDALVLKIRDGGSVQRRACYLAMAITMDGDRDVLGLWFQARRFHPIDATRSCFRVDRRVWMRRRRGSVSVGCRRVSVWLIRARFRAGALVEEVVDEFGVSLRSAYRLRDEVVLVRRRVEHSPHRLSFEERERISRSGSRRVSPIAQIARVLGRHRSTIGREITRCGRRHQYRALRAERKAQRAARRPKEAKAGGEPAVVGGRSSAGLCERCSPEQISARLRLEFPDDPEMRISHETIYRALYRSGARGAAPRARGAHLRPAASSVGTRARPGRAPRPIRGHGDDL